MTFDAIGIAGTGLNLHRHWLDAIPQAVTARGSQGGSRW